MSEEKNNQPNKQIEEIKKEVVVILDYCQDLKIETKEEMVQATDVLKRIVDKKKEFELTRQALVKPLNDHVKNINLMFKGSMIPLIKMEEKIKDDMLEYRKEEAMKIERERQEEEARQKKEFDEEQKKKLAEADSRKEKKEIKKEEFEAKTADIKQDSVIKGDKGSIRVKKVWDFEIEDELQVPVQYKIVNEKAIRKAIKDGVREISGVKIFQKEQIGAY